MYALRRKQRAPLDLVQGTLSEARRVVRLSSKYVSLQEKYLQFAGQTLTNLGTRYKVHPKTM